MTAGLAGDTPQATEFFAKLRRRSYTATLWEEDPQSRRLESVAVPGYVFWPEGRHSGNPPVGFGLFRALNGGYELWLAGLEFERRGGGHGPRAHRRALRDAARQENKGGPNPARAHAIAPRWPTCSRRTSSR